MKPLAIDLFCGLGGWTDGLLAEGYEVIGFDIERHEYGEHRYPAKLVLQDVLTLDGAQFADARLIVASPPCQEYSYMAMPWRRSRQIRAALKCEPALIENASGRLYHGVVPFPDGYTGSRNVAELNALFDACFRIQNEACEAAGRHIPLVVENVRGAQEWVGRSRWNYGSYHLWGDVPALMPMALKTAKNPGFDLNPGTGKWHPGDDDFAESAIKNTGGSWFNIAHNTTSGHGQNPDGRKGMEPSDGDPTGLGYWRTRAVGDQSMSKRKFASAMIAKIPLPLSRHIARVYAV